jgi:hypothetical protein
MLMLLLVLALAMDTSAQTQPTYNGLRLVGARITGTTEMNAEELLRGLDLHAGEPITLSEIRIACHRLEDLLIYKSLNCSAVREDDSAWIVLQVPVSSTRADNEDGIIFDNFVWMSRAEILQRIKKAVPLFTSHIQLKSPLNDDVLRVLNQLLAERGMKAQAIRDEFWVERDKNVYKATGISVPVVSIEVTGENAPRQIKQWSGAYDNKQFSMALLNWRLNEVIENYYYPRGYLHPVVQEPEVISLGVKEGAFPVKIILRVDAGTQYTFKSLRLEGRALAHEAELRKAWTLKPGSPYDVGYGRQFYFSVQSSDWAQQGKASSAGSDCTRVDVKEHTVTLTIKIPESNMDRTLSAEAKPCTDLLVDYFFTGNVVEQLKQ